MLKKQIQLWPFFLLFFMLLLTGCSSGSSASDSASQALACTTTEEAIFVNNCDFNVFVEVLDGDDDDSGRDFFVPSKSSISLPVMGDFTYGVCKEPQRPEQDGSDFRCV